MATTRRASCSAFTILFAGASLLAALSSTQLSAKEVSRIASVQSGAAMKIRIDVAGGSVTATLENNEASRDFVTQLPMTLTLEDYASTEKVSDLPKPLSTQGAPAGFTPSSGDITFYAPWGNLAIFHKGFRYSSGLIKLGRIDSGLEVLAQPGPVKVTINLVSE